MNGILNVYKEKGFTSHDVVAKLRGICHQKRIGHTGTLDPQAEGVLPVCFGTATRVCELLTNKSKEYEVVLRLGIVTDTQDLTGQVLQEQPVACSEEEVFRAVSSFVGVQLQVPPMYSALKVNGKKLYELARSGIEVERKPREISIERIEILSMELPRVKLRVSCSKGTYIRTLCHDIGQKLGCGGCMESLLRTRAGSFGLEQALTLPRIQQLAAEGTLEAQLLSVDRLFLDYPAVQVKDRFYKLLENGNRLPGDAWIFEEKNENGSRVCAGAEQPMRLRVYFMKNRERIFFGIYEADDAKNDFKPLKIFWQRNQT